MIAVSALAETTVTPEEMTGKSEWVKSTLLAEAGACLPFSFTYDGQSSASLLPSWKRKAKTSKLDADRIQHVLTWTDPKTGLRVRAVAVEYRDCPTVEWTLHFQNTGKQDTPILENIQAIDARFQRGEKGEFLLHHAIGSPCTPHDFQPLETVLGPKEQKRIAAAGGRPTTSDLCYFNLEWQGEGLIIALGWPGQWAATFTRDEQNGVRVVGGQELTHFRLHPGEEARSPLVALQFWQGGDWIRAQNVWRRWMVAHNLPRPGGKLISTLYGSHSPDLFPDAKQDLARIDGFEREGIALDWYKIDAGWYPAGRSPEAAKCMWCYSVGTWEPDRARFPKGVREVADRLHKRGAKLCLWFEPERVYPGTKLFEEHPEWLLFIPPGTEDRLLNLGNPEARQWMTDHLDRCIKEEGVDIYREDFNMDPLPHWRTNDAPDRQGLTEIHHVQGHLALWDELLRRHPGLAIDTCASGGRRLDLETLRRSVPLLRSDYTDNPDSQQAQTLGLSLWVPYHGSGLWATADVYGRRSYLLPAVHAAVNTSKSEDYANFKAMQAEFRRVEAYLLGDFYPLTPFSRAMDTNVWAAAEAPTWPPKAPDRPLALDVWAAWQFDRPEMGAGIVQVFRRAESPYEQACLRLHGLDPKATYRLENFDRATPTEASGKDLMETGLGITLPQRRTSCIVKYQRVKSAEMRN